MAEYSTTLMIPAPIETTFGFVSDFRNAAIWDPRTYTASNETGGPIRVGTRFMLVGGLLRQDILKRLHIPESIAGIALPYDVVELDEPFRFVLEGESSLVRYGDRLEFAEAEAGTRLEYSAKLELKGVLSITDAMLSRLFERIGDDATRGIASAVADYS
jgi:hypothetical protein